MKTSDELKERWRAVADIARKILDTAEAAAPPVRRRVRAEPPPRHILAWAVRSGIQSTTGDGWQIHGAGTVKAEQIGLQTERHYHDAFPVYDRPEQG